MTSSVHQSPEPELIGALAEKMRHIRVLNAELLELVAQAESEQLARQMGYRNAAALLAEILHLTPPKAGRLVRQAEQISESLTPTGHTTPAALPTVREVLQAGLIDGDHIDVIADAMKALPMWATHHDRQQVETSLAATARDHNPHTVRAHGDVLVQAIDHDGHDPHQEAKLAEPTNTFTYRRTRDGRMTFTGELEQESAELFENLLGVLAELPDHRPKAQRLGDAFSDLIDRASTSPNLPTRGGARPRLSVILDLTTLTDAVGAATLEAGSPIAPSAARRLACDAEIIPMVLDSNSVPIDVGRTRRLVKPTQRAALVARDRGCAMPGCTIPARWTNAHHITLARRRPHRSRQPGPSLPPPPPPTPSLRVASPHRRRRTTRIHFPQVGRPTAPTYPQHPPQVDPVLA